MPLVIKDHKVVYEKPTQFPVFGRLMSINPIYQTYRDYNTIRSTSSVMNVLQKALLSK